MSLISKCSIPGLLALAMSVLVQPIQARVVQVATINYAPFSGEELREGGFQTAVLRAAFIAAGHEPVFNFYPWKRAYAMTIDGRADFVTSIFFNEDRDKILNFSDTVYVGEVGLVALKSLKISEFSNLEDLKPYRIGVLAGAIFQEEFDKADYLKKVVVHRDQLNMPMLFNGRVDMVATSLIYFQHKVANSEKFDVKQLKILRPSLKVRSVYVAASRQISDHNELVADFNRGMREIKANGTFQKIAASFGILHLRDDGERMDKSS